jgi:hypothetical protein
MEIRITQRDHNGTGCPAHRYPPPDRIFPSPMAGSHPCPPPKKLEYVTLVEKVRTIVLFQGDFNYLNNYIGCHIMKDREANEQLTWEQYGSREGKKAIDHSLNKVFSFDLIRKARVDAAMCSNDAKSCYDRIVHAIASILMQQQNVPASACICFFTYHAAEPAPHRQDNIYGDSKSGYEGT